MDSITRYVIRQNVRLVNNTNEWIDITSSSNESQAFEAYDKAKRKSNDVVLVKITEHQLR